MTQQALVGSRATIREAGGTSVAVGMAATLLTISRNGWYADIDVAHCLFGASVLVALRAAHVWPVSR